MKTTWGSSDERDTIATAMAKACKREIRSREENAEPEQIYTVNPYRERLRRDQMMAALPHLREIQHADPLPRAQWVRFSMGCIKLEVGDLVAGNTILRTLPNGDVLEIRFPQ